MKDDGNSIDGVPATASLWVLLPKLVIGIIQTTILILIAFWLYFDRIDSYAFLIAAIFALFQVLIVIGLRFQNRSELQAREVAPGRLDRLGAFWLIAVIFGALLGWFTGDAARWYPDSSIPFHVLTVVFTMLAPIATSIPNYRYVTAANAYITLPLLTIVTMLPAIVGLGSAAALFTHFKL